VIPEPYQPPGKPTVPSPRIAVPSFPFLPRNGRQARTRAYPRADNNPVISEVYSTACLVCVFMCTCMHMRARARTHGLFPLFAILFRPCKSLVTGGAPRVAIALSRGFFLLNSSISVSECKTRLGRNRQENGREGGSCNLKLGLGDLRTIDRDDRERKRKTKRKTGDSREIQTIYRPRV